MIDAGILTIICLASAYLAACSEGAKRYFFIGAAALFAGAVVFGG